MDHMLTSADVAKILGVPRRTVDDWRRRRVGPAYVKVGKHVRYRPDDIESYADENRVSAR